MPCVSFGFLIYKIRYDSFIFDKYVNRIDSYQTNHNIREIEDECIQDSINRRSAKAIFTVNKFKISF